MYQGVQTSRTHPLSPINHTDSYIQTDVFVYPWPHPPREYSYALYGYLYVDDFLQPWDLIPKIVMVVKQVILFHLWELRSALWPLPVLAPVAVSSLKLPPLTVLGKWISRLWIQADLC